MNAVIEFTDVHVHSQAPTRGEYAGYVFAQGSALLVGEKLPRSEIVLDHEPPPGCSPEFASKVV